MTARIDPARLCSPTLLRDLPAMTRRRPRVWLSLLPADQGQLASTLAEMVRRMAAGAAQERDDAGDRRAR